MKGDQPTRRWVKIDKRDGTPRLTITFSGELSHGKSKDMSMHEGISVNFREGIETKKGVGQNEGLPVDGNSERGRTRVRAFTSGKKEIVVVKTREMSGFRSERIVIMVKSLCNHVDATGGEQKRIKTCGGIAAYRVVRQARGGVLVCLQTRTYIRRRVSASFQRKRKENPPTTFPLTKPKSSSAGDSPLIKFICACRPQGSGNKLDVGNTGATPVRQ
jgi:hypothetical protein